MPVKKTARKPAAKRRKTARKPAAKRRKTARRPATKLRKSAREPARKTRKAARRTVEEARRGSGLTAADLMERDVLTVRPDTPVNEVSAVFKLHNIKGAPVVERGGDLVGIITEDDLVFGQLGIPDEERELLTGAGPGARPELNVIRRVAEIMTQNPIAAEETTPVEELCHIMSRLKIHRVPIVRDRKVVGIVSTIDICRILSEGRARLVRV